MPSKRLGTAHRIAVMRLFGLAKRSGSVAVDIGGFDGEVVRTFRGHDYHVVVDPGLPVENRLDNRLFALRGSGESLPIKSGTVDTVLLLDVLEHVTNPERIVREAVRILTPDGAGIVTVPAKDIRVVPGSLQSWVNRRWGHTLRSGFTEAELREIMDRSGAQAVEVIPLATPIFRALYFPLVLSWKLAPLAVAPLLWCIERIDFRLKGADVRRGYLLCQFTRRSPVIGQ